MFYFQIVSAKLQWNVKSKIDSFSKKDDKKLNLAEQTGLDKVFIAVIALFRRNFNLLFYRNYRTTARKERFLKSITLIPVKANPRNFPALA
jgi:hypothetical protein